MSFAMPFMTQPPLRASADVNPRRVVKRTGTYTGAQAASAADQPLGISAEWTRLPPIQIFSPSGLHAVGANADPISYYGRGAKAHADVGTALTGTGLVMADSNGKVKAFVAPGWAVGYNLDPAPVDSQVEVYVDPVYIGATLAQLSLSTLKTLTAAGHNGAGAITLTGAVIGDRVVAVLGIVTAYGSNNTLSADETLFESTITVADQIQQSSATDLSGNNYLFVLAPALA